MVVGDALNGLVHDNTTQAVDELAGQTIETLHRRYLEAALNLMDLQDRYVGRSDDHTDIGLNNLDNYEPEEYGFFDTNESLKQARIRCRLMALENEFAINGHENRINYIVNDGLIVKVMGRDESVPSKIVEDVRAMLREFDEQNQLWEREQEAVRRYDRDGEVLIRLFSQRKDVLQIRAVEPAQLTDQNGDFGIITRPRDPERVVGYRIENQVVPVDQIIHLKANVDLNDPRGIPLFWPVRENLSRSEKLLRNMSIVAAVQSSVAMIRKYENTSADSIRAMVQQRAATTIQDPLTGKARQVQPIRPGQIIDAKSGVSYEFPIISVSAASFVEILNADLRAIASRCVMPEFMLTSNASNANYSSTLVSQAPAHRMFRRSQRVFCQFRRQLVMMAIRNEIRRGRFDESVLKTVAIEVEPPSLEALDPTVETQRNSLLNERGVLSLEDWTAREKLDFKTQQAKIGQESAKRSTERNKDGQPGA